MEVRLRESDLAGTFRTPEGKARFPRAGHMLFPYVRPSDAMFPAYPVDLGGTGADDLAAHGAVLPRVIEHMRGKRQELAG
jgi:hypothetical protein